jgi:NodT family efflux transporter outer membrane factor (OMF) lipoprotein
MSDLSRTALALLCAGCAAGPDFQRPEAPAADRYLPDEAARAALAERIPAEWWQLFRNARLDGLLAEILQANHTLEAARATLLASHEAVVQARAALLPQEVDLVASARGTSVGAAGDLFAVGPTVSYSVDAFGGTRRHVEQEEALEELQRQELSAAYLTLTGNAVTEAVTIASVRLEIATVEELIANDQKNLSLVQREFEAGKVAKSDVLTAAAQLATDRTQLPGLRQQLAVARHALAVLIGRPAGTWVPPDFDAAELTLPENVPLSVPSELVRKRPDILAAEALLHADSAAIGVATAQLYPSITLNASFTHGANALGDLFGSAASNVVSGGGSFDQPLFRGGALASQREAAVYAYRAQLATYQQTVLLAFGQVADALTALSNDAEAVAVSREAAAIAEASLSLQRTSFAAGKTTVLQLIVAENTYATARLAQVRAQGQQMLDAVQLLVGVGGGFPADGVGGGLPADGAGPGAAPGPR